MKNDPRTAPAEKGQPSYDDEFRAIGEILTRDAPQIMERWLEQASEQQVYADPARREEAMNDLLNMLRSLGQRLTEQSWDALEQATTLARGHGQQRAIIGWDVVALVRDYEILHAVALEHLGKTLNERLTYRQAMVLGVVTDKAIGSAVKSFNEMAQERLERLNRELDEQVQRQRGDLRQLTLDLSNAEHHERQRIARQVHDDLQQMLVAIQMTLRQASDAATPASSAVDRATELANEAIDLTRNLTADLYPRTLENASLPDAIDKLAESFQQRFGLTVTVDLQVSRGSDPGPPSLRRLVYDAIRELLFNVVKHARTDRAWVRICCDDEPSWSIVVEDRGVGSDSTSTAPTGFGLEGIRQRFEHLGGAMEVHSKPGEGTRIALTVPLE